MTGIIILAAGASVRMGQPKQALQFQGETLLQRAIRTALESSAQSVVVVLGAYAGYTNAGFDDERLSFYYNDNWQQGMSSSIKAGLQQLLKIHPEVENALLMLCDQPFVSTQLLNQLIHIQLSQQAAIVSCTYQDAAGAPALFNRQYFNALLALTGQEGARKLLTKFSELVVTVPFSEGSIDVDTPEDYQRLKGNE